MSRRQLLSLTVTLLALLGVAFVFTPFAASLSPTERAQSAHEYPVALGSVPDSGFSSVDWLGYRVFLAKNPEIRVFRIPLYDGKPALPDLTWARAIVPCGEFVFRENLFQCVDQAQHEWWRINARWHANGASVNPMFPALESPPFVVSGNQIIIGRNNAR